MSAAIPIGRSFDLLHEKALLLGSLGYRVFPLKPGTKEPRINRWPEMASFDASQIAAWFADSNSNLGLACGPQPNGRNILAIDIDNHGVDGKVTWADLINRHGRGTMLDTPQHRTPNDGHHWIFDSPVELANSRARIGPGIDTRGAGGFIVLPPSRLIDVNGEIRNYTTRPGRALWEAEPQELPSWVVGLLTADQAGPTPIHALPSAAVPVSTSDDSPLDWARRNLSWEQELVAAGWRYLYERGGDSYWARPGKTDRGHSAVLHQSGAFTVFSTEVPPQLENLGRPTSDRTGFTVSIGEFYAAYRHGGDLRAASQELRRQMPPSVRAERSSNSSQPAPDGVGRAAQSAEYTLPEEFWSSRSWLQHIRTAAQSTMVSPDALFVSVLSRYAALVPPSYRLPGIVGTAGTFDFLCAVVAETGGGKSAANAVARQLLPNPYENSVHPEESVVQMDLPAGSGEGIIQTFFIEELDDNGKRTGKQKVGKQGAHFTVDEGAALMSTAKRDGTTILPTLCSAWSGQVLGQANAAADRRRIIQPGRVRVCAVINMQSSNGWRLFEPEVAVLGFPGRLIFATAHDRSAPDPEALPEWPGQIRFQIPPIIAGGVDLTYDSTITGEVRRSRSQSLTGEVAGDPLKSQHLLARCKVAGLVALLEGRRHVSADDWLLAGTVMRTSGALLDSLVRLRSEHVRADRHARAMSRAEADTIVDDVREKRAVAKLADAIAARVDELNEVPRNKLGRMVTSSTTRHRFDESLALAVQLGKVRIEGDRVVAAGGGK